MSYFWLVEMRKSKLLSAVISSDLNFPTHMAQQVIISAFLTMPSASCTDRVWPLSPSLLRCYAGASWPLSVLWPCWAPSCFRSPFKSSLLREMPSQNHCLNWPLPFILLHVTLSLLFQIKEVFYLFTSLLSIFTTLSLCVQGSYLSYLPLCLQDPWHIFIMWMNNFLQILWELLSP